MTVAQYFELATPVCCTLLEFLFPVPVFQQRLPPVLFPQSREAAVLKAETLHF